jgi:hypothetical protein
MMLLIQTMILVLKALTYIMMLLIQTMILVLKALTYIMMLLIQTMILVLKALTYIITSMIANFVRSHCDILAIIFFSTIRTAVNSILYVHPLTK